MSASSNFVFKFIDEATGLFWNGKLKQHVEICFGEHAIEYRNRKAALAAFRNYEVIRLWTPALGLPVVKMQVLRVDFIEVEREEFNSSPDDLRLTRFALLHGKQDHLTGFVRALSERSDFMEFQYIVGRLTTWSPFDNRRKIIRTDLSPLTSPVLSSRKTGRKYVAVRTDADLLYLRMSLGEQFGLVYDLNTGEKI